MAGAIADPFLLALAVSAIKPTGRGRAMSESGFLIENAATRASLKSAFDHLFLKYGREFADDDEIDLADLSIIKHGNHVAREQPRYFGTCFKKSTLLQQQQQQLCTENNLPNSLPEDPIERDKRQQEENYDDVFVRLSGKVKEAHRIRQILPMSPIPSLVFQPAIEQKSSSKRPSSLKDVIQIVPKKPKKSKPKVSISQNRRIDQQEEAEFNFDDILAGIIWYTEGISLLSSKPLKSIEHICNCCRSTCFDCSLIDICNSTERIKERV